MQVRAFIDLLYSLFECIALCFDDGTNSEHIAVYLFVNCFLNSLCNKFVNFYDVFVIYIF